MGTDRSDSGPVVDEQLLDGRVVKLVERGLERYGAGDLDGALSEWEHALALDPECDRANEYAAYVRSHFSALVKRFDDAGKIAEAAAELDVPFGLEALGAKSAFDLEAYEEMEVDSSASVDMGVPAGYENLVDDDTFVAEDDEVTKPYSPEFSDESTRDIRPAPELAVGTNVEIVPAADEHAADFDDSAKTIERSAAKSSSDGVDDGWDFDQAPTQMFDRAQSERSASGQLGSPTSDGIDEGSDGIDEGDRTDRTERTGSGPSIELAPDLEAVASYSEPPDHTDEGIADALDAVAAGLESIDLSIERPSPSDSIRLGLPSDAESDLESTQAGEGDRTAKSQLGDYEGLDLGEEFDRDMGDVIEQPAEDSAKEDDDREPLSITIEAEEPAEPPSGEDVELGKYTQPARETPSTNLNIELGHLEQIDESMRDEDSGIRPNQRVVLGSGRQPKAVEISFHAADSNAVATSRPPTEDPSISEASIDLDDSLLNFEQPTREHEGIRDVVAALDSEMAGVDSDEASSRETSELARSATGALTRELDRTPQAPQGTTYKDVAADMLNELDEGCSDAESPEDRTRRRVSALIERAEREVRDSQFVRAVICVDLALQEDPESAVAQKVIHRRRDLLLEVYKSYLGVLTNVPALAVPMHELSLHEIDHRAAFLLSRIDGALSFDDILDVSGMSRLEAFRHLSKLLLQGVLEVR